MSADLGLFSARAQRGHAFSYHSSTAAVHDSFTRPVEWALTTVTFRVSRRN